MQLTPVTWRESICVLELGVVILVLELIDSFLRRCQILMPEIEGIMH